MDESLSIETQLAVINVKLDVILASREDHETRLRTLERFRWVLMGLAITAGPVFEFLINK